MKCCAVDAYLIAGQDFRTVQALLEEAGVGDFGVLEAGQQGGHCNGRGGWRE